MSEKSILEQIMDELSRLNFVPYQEHIVNRTQKGYLTRFLQIDAFEEDATVYTLVQSQSTPLRINNEIRYISHQPINHQDALSILYDGKMIPARDIYFSTDRKNNEIVGICLEDSYIEMSRSYFLDELRQINFPGLLTRENGFGQLN